MTTMQTDPRFTFDPAMEAYRYRESGEYVNTLPPTRRWRYIVTKDGCRVGQREFKPGQVVGEGNVTTTYPAAQFCRFDEAENYDGSDPLTAGHVLARLINGNLRAEPIDDEVGDD